MKGFPKTVSILALPLFIEGNRRVSENRQGVYSLSVEREPIRDCLQAQYPEGGRELKNDFLDIPTKFSLLFIALVS